MENKLFFPHFRDLQSWDEAPWKGRCLYCYVCFIKIFSIPVFFTIRIYLQRKDHQLSANDLVACTHTHTQKKYFRNYYRNGTDFLILQRETLLWNNVLSLQILYDMLLTWLLQIPNCSEHLSCTFSKTISGALSLYIPLVALISCLLWPFSIFLLCYGSICWWWKVSTTVNDPQMPNNH